MKIIKSYLKTYFVALVLISLPFFILLMASYLCNINPDIIVYGLTFAVISSLAIAYNFRNYEKSVAFTNESLFINDLTNSLSKLGYIVKDRTAGSIEFEPTVHAHLLAGNILIHFADNLATIQGTRLQVRKGLNLALNQKERLLSNTPLEECLSVMAEEKKSLDLIPEQEDYLMNSPEEGIALETNAALPEEE